MKKNIFVKSLVLLLSVSIILLSFSSCTRNNKEDRSANASALVNQNAIGNDTSDKKSVVVVPVPTVNNSQAQETNEVISNEVINEPIVVPPVITEEVIVPEVSVNNEKANVNVPLITELPLEENTKDDATLEIESNRYVFFYKDLYFAHIVTFSDGAEVSFLEPYPSLDVISFVSEKIIENYPSTLNDISYTFSDGKAEISFPEGYLGNKEEESQILLIVNDIATKALDEYFAQNNIDSNDDIISRDYVLYGKNATINASKDRAVITSSDIFTEAEIMEALEIIRVNYPNETKDIIYTINSDNIELIYPEMSKADINYALDALENLIHAYTPMPITEEFVEESGAIPAIEAVKPVEVVDSEISSVKASLDMPNKVKRFEVGLSGKLGLNFNNDNILYGNFDLRFSYTFNEYFSLGIKGGYSTLNYIPLRIFGQIHIPQVKGLYFTLNAGLDIGLGSSNTTRLAFGAGIGYAYEIKDNLRIFGELDFDLTFNQEKKLGLGFVLGVSYKF